MPTLFDPIDLGGLHLPNRVFMAPLTRARAVDRRIPNELMRDYYVQRATAGLILSEATSVTPQGVGYADTPGIWSPGAGGRLEDHHRRRPRRGRAHLSCNSGTSGVSPIPCFSMGNCPWHPVPSGPPGM